MSRTPAAGDFEMIHARILAQQQQTNRRGASAEPEDGIGRNRW